MSLFTYNSTMSAPVVTLTEREKEVLVLAAEGKPSKQIGQELFISRSTVDFHLGAAFAKLDVPNRLAAYRKAVRLGLLQPLAS